MHGFSRDDSDPRSEAYLSLPFNWTWRHGRKQRPQPAPGSGREPEAEEHGCRAVAGQPGSEGRAVKKLVEPAGRREAANYVEQTYGISERHACRLIGLARSTRRYCAGPALGNEGLRK